MCKHHLRLWHPWHLFVWISKLEDFHRAGNGLVAQNDPPLSGTFQQRGQEQSSGKRAEEFSTTGCTMCTRPICVYALYPHTAVSAIVHLTHLVVTLSLVFPLSYLGARYHTQAGARKAKEKKRESEPTYSYFVGRQCFQGRTALHWELELP